MASQPVVVVAGPTASGKSALALDLARCLNGVIINADALQLYRDLPILTARPGTAMMAAAPHQLFGILDPDEVSSAGWWRRQAQQTIEATLAQGKLPILVGGTGLYLRSLMEGISSIPPIPQPIRDATRQHLQGVGHEAFHAELSQLDPETAARLKVGDTQRLLRAYEVVKATNKPLSFWQRQAKEKAPYRFYSIILLPPRGLLYARIEDRFDSMIKAGALEELKELRARGVMPKTILLKALGVPALLAYLAGDLSFDQAIIAAKTATRRYAKRQYTWFRGQMRGDAVYPCFYPDPAAPLDEILKKLQEWLIPSNPQRFDAQEA